MTRIIVKELIWDEWNKEHIGEHNVTILEVEEAVVNFIVHKKAKKGRYLVIGRSGTRIISLVVRREAVGVYYVVTARDAAKKERKRVYEKEKI